MAIMQKRLGELKVQVVWLVYEVMKHQSALSGLYGCEAGQDVQPPHPQEQEAHR